MVGECQFYLRLFNSNLFSFSKLVWSIEGIASLIKKDQNVGLAD